MRKPKQPLEIVYPSSCIFLFIGFKDAFDNTGYSAYLISAILGALGAGVGYSIYETVKNKKPAIQYLVLAGTAVILLGLMFIVYSTKAKQDNNLNHHSAQAKNKIRHDINETHDNGSDTSFVTYEKLNSLQKINLLTCQICGYISREKDSSYCYVCYSSIIGLEDLTGSQQKEFIKNEQLFFFSADDFSNVMFYSPKINCGFRKDLRWQPSVSEQEVKAYNRNFSE